MAIETKATVAIDSLSSDEACTILRLFGLEPGSAERLYGGYASSNFKVVGRRASDEEPLTLLLKINYYGLTREDAEHQLQVMKHLMNHGFPTNYPHATPNGDFLVEHEGRKAMLLDFVQRSRPGQEVLADDEGRAPGMLAELGEVLARLHLVEWPTELGLRDIRAGYPVCNTGELLAGQVLEELAAGPLADEPFVAFVRGKLGWLRELYDRKVPWGLIHGDAFLDNTLFGVDGGGLLAIIDWEDSCVGPYALDLAVCASACCFTAGNELMPERLRGLLVGYQRKRALLPQEQASFVDFMLAGAMACGFYRFCEFNVRQPESTAEAKGSYRIMFERAQRLEAGGTIRQAIQAELGEPGP